MGLFSFFSKDKEKDALSRLSQLLGGGDVRHKPNDQVWEWRGEVGGIPARAQLGGPYPEVWIRSVHDHGHFTIERNPALVSNAGDSAEEAWSEDEVVRLFVGPGIFLESLAYVMPEEAAAFHNLPGEGASRIVAAMPGHQASGVNTQPEDVLLRFEPRASMENVAQFSELVASVMGTEPTMAATEARAAVEEGEDESWSERRVRCQYCSCSFLLGPDGKCPNCGAPA